MSFAAADGSTTARNQTKRMRAKQKTGRMLTYIIELTVITMDHVYIRYL